MDYITVSGNRLFCPTRCPLLFATCLCLLARQLPAGQTSAAQSRIEAGDFRGARELLQFQLHQTPGDIESWNLLGISETELGEMQAAEQAFQHGLALAPQSVSLNENAGLLYFRETKYTEAKRLLARAVAAGSGKPGVKFSLAAARLRTGEQALALRDLQALENSLAGRPEYWDERGQAELALDTATAAEKSFERALSLSTLDATAWNGAATAAEKQGLDEKALATLVKAQATNPNDVSLLMHFASVCIRRDLGPDAITALDKARRLDPSNFAVLYLLARANISVANWQQAHDLFQQFSAHDPTFAPAYFALGWLDIRLNRTAQARSELQHCLQLAPDLTEARYTLAQLEFDDGNMDQAEELLHSVLQQNPHHSQANMTLGDIELRRGNLPAAQRLLESAVKSDPKLAAAHYKLSTVLQREHRPQEANAEKQIAAQLNNEAHQAGRTQLKLVLPETAVNSNPPNY